MAIKDIAKFEEKTLHQSHYDFSTIQVLPNLLEALPKVGNVLSLFFYLKDYPCFDLTPHEQDIIINAVRIYMLGMNYRRNTYFRNTLNLHTLSLF